MATLRNGGQSRCGDLLSAAMRQGEVLALLVMAMDGRSTATRWCSGSLLRFFGPYSYVFHLPVIYFVERYLFGIDDVPTFYGQSIGRTIAVCLRF
jgi:hypothetical protein